jgi:hypothetical protein
MSGQKIESLEREKKREKISQHKLSGILKGMNHAY